LSGSTIRHGEGVLVHVKKFIPISHVVESTNKNFHIGYFSSPYIA